MNDLKNAAPALDTKAADETTAVAAVHRTWMDSGAFFTDDYDEAILEEATRGDKAAIKEYDEVLADAPIPQKAAELIRAQRIWF